MLCTPFFLREGLSKQCGTEKQPKVRGAGRVIGEVFGGRVRTESRLPSASSRGQCFTGRATGWICHTALCLQEGILFCTLRTSPDSSSGLIVSPECEPMLFLHTDQHRKQERVPLCCRDGTHNFISKLLNSSAGTGKPLGFFMLALKQRDPETARDYKMTSFFHTKTKCHPPT